MPSPPQNAAAILAEALGQALHHPGERQRHRAHLARAIELAQAEGDRITLVRALAARAEDARHGANQLSQGSQRAPTRAACDDGWERVASIVAVAEAAARQAARLAADHEAPGVAVAAEKAQRAARAARRIARERNHAYTFHAAPGFSFGEGWYVAAAGLLGGIDIQVEPEAPHTAAALRFLRDAGLGPQLVPYRSRPRANKHLPDIVATAFRRDPSRSQRDLRAAFVGDGDVPADIVGWVDHALADAPAGDKVLLWVRHAAHHPHRNTDRDELLELSRRSRRLGLVPILFGDAPASGAPPGAIDLTFCWKQGLFQGTTMRRAQLQLFEQLRRAHGVVGQLGVTTAGMDGPALMGLPTMYLTDATNVRMRAWVGAVPGYEEVVRGEGYLERITETLERWATKPSEP